MGITHPATPTKNLTLLARPLTQLFTSLTINAGE